MPRPRVYGDAASQDPADGPPRTPGPEEEAEEEDDGARGAPAAAVSPRQLALLASMVEETARALSPPSSSSSSSSFASPPPPPRRDSVWVVDAAPPPPPTPGGGAADDDEEDEDGPAGRGDPRDRGADSDSDSESDSGPGSASGSEPDDEAEEEGGRPGGPRGPRDDEAGAEDEEGGEGGGAEDGDPGAGAAWNSDSDSDSGAPPPPPPPGPAARDRRPPSSAASAGRSERRRARAAVAGRDATGRFTAAPPRPVPLDADEASGAFYARYRDGYVGGEPWPGAEPPPPGRVLYGGLGDSRPGLWGAPEVEEARRRYEAAGAPAPVWAPELGDAARQYALITRLLFAPDREAMGWLQNPRVTAGDVELDRACFEASGARRNSSSFITGTVARAVPHLGYAMAAGRFGWGLAHAAAAVAMSRRYDRAQKGFLVASLRRAYAPLLARENAAAAGAAAPPAPDAADGAGAAGPAAPAGYGAAGVIAAQRRLAAALSADGAAEDRGDDGGEDRGDGAAEDDGDDADAAAECLAACRAVLEALAEGYGGDLAAVPGLAAARAVPPPRGPGAPPPRPRLWLRELRRVRDALVLMRLRGDLRVPGGAEAAVAAVRAVGLVAGAAAPLLPRPPRRVRSAAAAAADLLFQNQSLRPLLGGAEDPGAARAPGRKRKSSSPPRPAAAAAAACPPARKKSRPAAARPPPPARPGPAPSPAPRRPAALTARPPAGPDPRGGWRRVPPGPSHTPAPAAAALDAYCAPRVVAELTDHPLFPEAWRAALTFDPRALASLAARCGPPEPGSGRLFGAPRASGPLRRAAAWMRQVADPEDVRVLVLYAPLPGEELGGVSPAPPAWTAARGGLSFLLAALGNRLCGPDTAAWAGNWTGPPDVSALGAQGVLLLSTRDLAFAGAVEFLGLLAAAAGRRLVVVDAVPPEEWPADGPALARRHVYLPCAVLPAAQCDVRWPAARDLRRAVLASGRVFGPGVFARVEAACARLYPDAPPPRLGRGANVRYRVRTRLGPDTPVPLPPREYRRAVLPALDGRAADSPAREAAAAGAPDFRRGEAHSHRACARWGLAAPLRPVYLALDRDAARAGPEALPPALRAFCARALLEPDPAAAPLVLRADADADPAAAPRVRWAAGRGDTLLADDDDAAAVEVAAAASPARGATPDWDWDWERGPGAPSPEDWQ
ncbi:transcriptional regulator ICP4 [Macacine alphaherpesvirus 3]|uniref:Transcriptional regulator ICP4 n=1 Tax=Macacine alphaherpesvirus 3 TaxID=2845555 RepID=A0A1X9WFW5_9ALPH|nr:transcriptional regulator ICP4 [Macacine alphaherpesvirus 1]YP_010797447.1 transcriptional regulator ICP4 [Macacine alphaherpesvirus 1]ARS01846.1 transcriptional regulator ICP4 [Macacine alphaherpesvirus 3]ARS01860.1 transcriptional regulator ICP4 [Macacine alphaherpesvirus 3]